MRGLTVVDGLTPDGVSARLHIADGRIAGVEHGVAATPSDLMMTPGLIDLQVNGCAGLDVNASDVSADLIEALTHAQWERGIARYCPTVITGPEERIVTALRAVAEARARDDLVRAAIPGVHVEGPHISPEDGPRGAHDVNHVRPADIAEFERWQEHSGGVVRIVTLAPEVSGAVEYTSAVADTGVLVSVGHTAAEPADIRRAGDAGARMSTHLGNGIFATLPRHPNALWAQLSDDRLTAGFIADGHHLPADTLVAMTRAKGRQRSLLVSDSTRLTGCPPGDYDEPVGGAVTLHPNGKLTLADSAGMAGSAASLDQCVGWAAGQLDGGLSAALEMASGVPDKLLSPWPATGFEVGAPADITFFRSSEASPFTPMATVLAGYLVAGDLPPTPSKETHGPQFT